jgi:hypothetical protein
MTDPDTGQDVKGDATVLAYSHVEDETFTTDLQQRVWEPMYGGLALLASCPVCDHPNAIDVFVPVVVPAFRGATRVPPEIVECQCAEDHHQPKGAVGCGRWGRISPQPPPPGSPDGQ